MATAGSPAYHPDELRRTLRAALERHGIEPQAAGRKAGMGQRTVVKFLEGAAAYATVSPNVAMLYKIRHEHGISIAEMVGETEPQGNLERLERLKKKQNQR